MCYKELYLFQITLSQVQGKYYDFDTKSKCYLNKHENFYSKFTVLFKG